MPDIETKNLSAAVAPQTEPPDGAKKFRNKIAIVLAALAVIALAAAAFFYIQAKQITKQLADIRQQQNRLLSQATSSGASAISDVEQLVEAVGKLMILPSDEQPTIATVQDLAKLQGQPFFAQAQVGDKVLIYTNAKKAILYRPGQNKIIEVAPLDTSAANSSSANLQTQPLTVEIRNGSGKTGAAQNFKQKLQGNSAFSVIKVGNAAAIYPNTLLYVTDAKKTSALAGSLQSLSLAKIITSLPAGEPSTSADAVLIIGKQ